MKALITGYIFPDGYVQLLKQSLCLHFLLFNCSDVELKWWFLSVIALSSSQQSKNRPQDVLQARRKLNSAKEFLFHAKLSCCAGFIFPIHFLSKCFRTQLCCPSKSSSAGVVDTCLCMNEPAGWLVIIKCDPRQAVKNKTIIIKPEELWFGSLYFIWIWWQ